MIKLILKECRRFLLFVTNLIKNSTKIENFDFVETATESKDVPKFKSNSWYYARLYVFW